MEPSPVLPEFQELHAFKQRASEVRDKLLDQALAHLDNALYAELLGRYAALSNEVSSLLVFLRSRVKDFDGALYQLWLEASVNSSNS
jgi:hypothetical protein